MTQNEQLPLKNSETWSVPCYIMTLHFRKTKDNKQLFKEGHLQFFDTH